MGDVWIVLVIGLAAVATVVFGAARFINWFRNRGERVVTCPENQRPAGVRLDALHTSSLRLSECSRWPERAGCGQECLTQIQESPNGCLVRKILADWYRGKSCASCGRPFGEIEWSTQKPALLSADKVSVDWSHIPAEKLDETLQAALPVCFACHMANTLVREHPDLVTDRSRRVSS